MRRQLSYLLTSRIDCAGAGADDAGDDSEKRSLAGAVGTDERDEFAAADRQINAVQRLNTAVAGAQAANLEQGGGRSGPRDRCLRHAAAPR